MAEETEGTNQPLTEAELTELKAQLETEQHARADFETKLAAQSGTIAEKDAQITELEQAVAEKDSALTTLKQASAETDAHLTTLNDTLHGAISAYKTVVGQAANPSVPGELITGDTIEAIDQSLESAKTLVAQVRTTIEAEIAAGKVPAGAPARTLPDLSALSPREKIQYAITKGGKS